jgi:aminoglycoside phosphotransferase (APT) family kinase protein
MADLVAVLVESHVTEFGSHTELLQKQGALYRIGWRVKLPPHTPVTGTALSEIARRHHVHVDGPFQILPETGIFNAHYALGPDLVLRVPRDHPEHFAALRREGIAIPAVRNAGVKAPELVEIDESCERIPAPFAVYRRVNGQTLESLALPPAAVASIWRELGRELYRTHSIEPADSNAALPPPGALADPREMVEAYASDGWFTKVEARWLLAWLARLAPFALAPARRRFVHGDTQGSNIMVSLSASRFVALMDWGSAAWGAQVDDLAVMPCGAVPFILEGYREHPIEEDTHLEARIVWRHLQLGLVSLPRGPQPALSWVERPLSKLLDTFAFFLGNPPEPWRGLGPERLM